MSRKTNRLRRRLEIANNQAIKHHKKLAQVTRILTGYQKIRLLLSVPGGGGYEAECVLEEFNVTSAYCEMRFRAMEAHLLG